MEPSWRLAGKARYPGAGECRRIAGYWTRAVTREKFLVWCAQLPAVSLPGYHGGQFQRTPMGAPITMGLDARIIAAHLISPYRLRGKSGKNDANDAAAICEAAKYTASGRIT